MKRLLAALAFISFAAPGFAQEMSPGLWELATEMKMQGMAMPPSKFTHCYTAKDIASGKQYGMDEQSKCTISNMKNAGGNISYDMSCAAHGGKMTGSVKGTMSPTAFAFEQKLRMTPDQGMGEMQSFIKGRRLGDCK
jgi:hypothetical protein